MIKNWERTRKSIRTPSGSPALWRQPTTVSSSSSAVFPSVPLHRLRESHTSDRNNREIYSRLVLTDGSRRQCAQISTTTRVTPVHSKGENIVPVRAVGAYIHVVSSFVTILPSVLIISETSFRFSTKVSSSSDILNYNDTVCFTLRHSMGFKCEVKMGKRMLLLQFALVIIK